MKKHVTLLVTNVNEGNNLFGQDLFDQFNFKIHQVEKIDDASRNSTADSFKQKYPDVFGHALGTIKNILVNIRLKQNAVPKFVKSRLIPYALLPEFRKEADRLIKAGIWKPVKFSEWASPIVLAKKPDGTVRICGDFKITINKQIDIEQHPLPLPEDILYHITFVTESYFLKLI
ncbi:uncharacterized protein K02A2.6-like [Teleopsis dalmanni]|uniref:uncharacterized protein K02A2.6-like n=1 Tax=Teleopsis dalmanni TaxID=139649 RepID=UPI0018CF5CFA|nr:uncharacterized protein K02A2.6-like [Teleopsis dalmanni]